MKKLLVSLALLLPLCAAAQTSTEFLARTSVGADYKIQKGLHLNVEEEIRLADQLSGLDNMRTTLGITCKPVKFLKIGAGYTLINPYKASKSSFNAPRHRLFADVTGYLRTGDFQFSLRERLQFTHRCGDFNTFQTTPNALALKSKLAVKYKGWMYVEPYAAFEVRTALNDPWVTLQYNSDGTPVEVYDTDKNPSSKSYHYYVIDNTAYSHLYNNRYRMQLGADIQFSKQHTLTPYLLMDYCSDYGIDTDGSGAHLYSAAYSDTFKISLGISYVFSF